MNKKIKHNKITKSILISILFSLSITGIQAKIEKDMLMSLLDNKNNKVIQKTDELELIIQNLTQATDESYSSDIIWAYNEEDEGNFDWNNYLNSALSSKAALVIDDRTGKVLYEKNRHEQVPIASITKLMAAMVLLDAKQNMNTKIKISKADVDTLKKSSSRLTVGTSLTRKELLLIGLMSSENRAIHALARNYPGGLNAFTKAMNVKAQRLGMTSTKFVEPTGLDPRNKSTAADIVKMAQAANNYSLIRNYSTFAETKVKSVKGKTLTYKNSNSLVRTGEWDISLQKTGYIREAGRCMVVKSQFGEDKVVMVLLGAPSSYSRISDAEQVKQALSYQR